MKGLQILLLNTVVIMTLAQLGSSNLFSSSSNFHDSRGGFPYPHSHRRRRSSESSSSVSNSEFQGHVSYYATKERGGKGINSNIQDTSEESVKLPLYRWRRSNEMGTLSITSGSVDSQVGYAYPHSSRQRRNTFNLGNRNFAPSFRFGSFRRDFLYPRNNEHFRTRGISFQTGSRTRLSNLENSRGGYPFPHSYRRRRSNGNNN